ncbi:hypothetical protein CB1_000234020 [Camelus ferus]|nr:hypothetical protein CB1_000234020 [Camelus ferus]
MDCPLMLSSSISRLPSAICLPDVACVSFIFLSRHKVAIVRNLVHDQRDCLPSIQNGLTTLRFFCSVLGVSLPTAITLEQRLDTLFLARDPCCRMCHRTTACAPSPGPSACRGACPAPQGARHLRGPMCAGGGARLPGTAGGVQLPHLGSCLLSSSSSAPSGCTGN